MFIKNTALRIIGPKLNEHRKIRPWYVFKGIKKQGHLNLMVPGARGIEKLH